MSTLEQVSRETVCLNSKELLEDLGLAVMANSSYSDSSFLVNIVHAIFAISEGRLKVAKNDIDFIIEFENK